MADIGAAECLSRAHDRKTLAELGLEDGMILLSREWNERDKREEEGLLQVIEPPKDTTGIDFPVSVVFGDVKRVVHVNRQDSISESHGKEGYHLGLF